MTLSRIWRRWCGAKSPWPPTDLSALENNLTVVEILDAAKRSAQTGERVMLK